MPDRQAGRGERRLEGVFDDRPRRPEGIGADPEHRRVAGAHHAGRVGEHVRASFEHEPDDAERRTSDVDGPPLVGPGLDDAIAGAGSVAPRAQPGDHVGPHLRRQLEARRRATAGRGPLDVAAVRRRDRTERGVVGETVGEHLEEPGDLRVGARSEGLERGDGGVDRGGRARVLAGRDVEEVARVVHDDQAVARGEPRRQIGGHERHAIAAEHDRLPGREGAQLLDHDRRN